MHRAGNQLAQVRRRIFPQPPSRCWGHCVTAPPHQAFAPGAKGPPYSLPLPQWCVYRSQLWALLWPSVYICSQYGDWIKPETTPSAPNFRRLRFSASRATCPTYTLSEKMVLQNGQKFYLEPFAIWTRLKDRQTIVSCEEPLKVLSFPVKNL